MGALILKVILAVLFLLEQGTGSATHPVFTRAVRAPYLVDNGWLDTYTVAWPILRE